MTTVRLRWLLAGWCAVLTIGLSLSAAAAFADGTCQFQLGFKTLHDLAAADVGDCLEDQHFAASGDAVQRTANGLLVWRKADNWTAFTDGSRTWLNGPDGLASRLNSERFAWEGAMPASSAPAVAPQPGASRIDKRSFSSAALGQAMPYTVYLPAGYDANPKRRYPAVYLLPLYGRLAEQRRP